MSKRQKPSERNQDIWELFKRSSEQQPVPPLAASTAKPKTAAEKKRDSRRTKRFLFITDLIAIIFWLYLITSTFFLNFGTGLARSLATLLAILVISFFFWRWLTLVALVYVLFFPLVVVFWKIPSLIYRRKSWIGGFAYLNFIAVFFRNVRYNLTTKSSGLIALLLIVAVQNKILSIISACWLFYLLMWSTARIFTKTAQSNWFLSAQEASINRLVDAKWRKNLSSVDKKILEGKIALLSTEQISAVTNALIARMIANRGLLLWAYGLQKYKRARLTLLFNGMAYFTLFLGGLFVFWLLNLVTLQFFPTQFSYAVHPSSMSVLLYTLDSFVLNEGPRLVAVGNLSEAIRIITGVYVFLALGSFVLGIIRSATERDDRSISLLVNKLRATADSEEELLIKQFKVGVTEAARRLAEIKKGFSWLMKVVDTVVPADFIEGPRGAPRPKNKIAKRL